MANLRGTDARKSLTGVRQRIADLEAENARLRSGSRLLQRGDYGQRRIPTDALQTTAAPGLVMLSASGFAIGTTPVAVLQGQVTVPARMTRCVVSLTGRAYATNSTAALDFLTARVAAAGVLGNGVPVRMPAGEARLNVATLAVVLEDLVPGGTFPVAVSVASTSASWAANPGNFVDLAGSLGWVS